VSSLPIFSINCTSIVSIALTVNRTCALGLNGAVVADSSESTERCVGFAQDRLEAIGDREQTIYRYDLEI
jgi:hypothetical protein